MQTEKVNLKTAANSIDGVNLATAANNLSWAETAQNATLAALAKVYNLDFHEAHHALEDAFVTAKLWQKLLMKLESMKIVSLRDLLQIAKA